MFNKTLLKDVGERALATALQTFIALFAVGDLSTLKGAGVSAIAAGLSVVKGFAASRLPIGDESASFVDANYVHFIEVQVPAKKHRTRTPAKKKAQ